MPEYNRLRYPWGGIYGLLGVDVFSDNDIYYPQLGNFWYTTEVRAWRCSARGGWMVLKPVVVVEHRYVITKFRIIRMERIKEYISVACVGWSYLLSYHLN